MLLRTIDAFESHPEIDAICIVSSEKWSGRLKYMLEEERFQKVRLILDGGPERRCSAFRGISRLMQEYSPEDIVLIHDAARPLVSGRIISDCISAAKECGACLAAVPVSDTIYECDSNLAVKRVPDRKAMYAAQTPQAFRLSLIYEGHKSADPDILFTDDASILAVQGIPVKLVSGEIRNLKITSPEDISAAEAYLRDESNK